MNDGEVIFQIHGQSDKIGEKRARRAADQARELGDKGHAVLCLVVDQTDDVAALLDPDSEYSSEQPEPAEVIELRPKPPLV